MCRKLSLSYPEFLKPFCREILIDIIIHNLQVKKLNDLLQQRSCWLQSLCFHSVKQPLVVTAVLVTHYKNYPENEWSYV